MNLRELIIERATMIFSLAAFPTVGYYLLNILIKV